MTDVVTTTYESVRIVPLTVSDGSIHFAAEGSDMAFCGTILPESHQPSDGPQLASRVAEAADDLRNHPADDPHAAAAEWAVTKRTPCFYCRKLLIDDVLDHECVPSNHPDLEWVDGTIYDRRTCCTCVRNLTIVYSEVGVMDSATGRYVDDDDGDPSAGDDCESG